MTDDPTRITDSMASSQVNRPFNFSAPPRDPSKETHALFDDDPLERDRCPTCHGLIEGDGLSSLERDPVAIRLGMSDPLCWRERAERAEAERDRLAAELEASRGDRDAAAAETQRLEDENGRLRKAGYEMRYELMRAAVDIHRGSGHEVFGLLSQCDDARCERAVAAEAHWREVADGER